MAEEHSCQCSNGDQIPLQKRELIRAYRNVHTLFLNALQTKTFASEYDRTMQYFYNAFWNILQYFHNGRCKCVRIKNYCSEAVSKAVIVRGESVRCIIVSYECNWSTPHGDQNRREQSKTRYNTIQYQRKHWNDVRGKNVQDSTSTRVFFGVQMYQILYFNHIQIKLWWSRQRHPSVVCYKRLIVLIKLEIESDWR